jgi:hypothetical protein
LISLAVKDLAKPRILTFNPGWDQNAQQLASFIAIDPDGNPLLFDQHV